MKLMKVYINKKDLKSQYQNLQTEIESNEIFLTRIHFALLLVILIHESVHVLLRVLEPEALDVFNNTKYLSKGIVEESGHYIEKLLFGDYEVRKIGKKSAKFLLNLSNWNMDPKKFKSEYEKYNKKDISQGGDTLISYRSSNLKGFLTVSLKNSHLLQKDL
jgi:hypothetical protein